MDESDIGDGYFTSQKDNCSIMLEWVSIDAMKKLEIYPSFIKEKIEDISDEIEHFVSCE
ncbi:hypothetical protein LJC01_01380 [Clostridiaceae bacterium OttesenSCG-928-D20]|nr:hypothetical protein [Clostridiaceae bacterium OttesenSCG-928-D20]